MRTDTPPPPSSPVDRLRAGFVRAGRRLAERAPGWSRTLAVAARGRGRWPIVLWTVAALGIAVLVAFAATTSSTPAGGFVRSGERFSRDDLETVRRALDAKHIPYQVDSSRVQVAVDQLDAANDVVGGLAVGPRPLSEIERHALESNLLDTPDTKLKRLEQAHEDELASLLRRIDGIAGAWVKIHTPTRRFGQRSASSATAFVSIETDDERGLSPSSVQNIVGLVTSFDPDVHPDAVSIFDRKGRQYTLAHDPAATVQARDRARAEELRRAITDELDWIKNVQVSVQLVPASSMPAAIPVPAPAPVPSATTTASTVLPVPIESLPPLPPEPTPTLAVAPALALAPAPPPAAVPPSVAVNQPLELGSDAAEVAPPTRPVPVVAEPTAPVPSPAPAVTPTPTPALASAPTTLAQILVKVPRNYYLNSYKQATPGREPSLDDLQPLLTRVETLINTSVRHVVPPGQLGEVSILTIPQEPPAPLSLAATTATAAADARRAASWWILGGVGAAAGLVLIVWVVRLAATRRPALRPAARVDRGRYKIDEAPGDNDRPGPTERVRDLIRLNPDAAASVLHRWTGQGGPG